MNKNNPKIIIDSKEHEIKSFWVSELGYLMMEVYFVNKKFTTNYNLGQHNVEQNIFTDLIKQYKNKTL